MEQSLGENGIAEELRVVAEQFGTLLEDLGDLDCDTVDQAK